MRIEILGEFFQRSSRLVKVMVKLWGGVSSTLIEGVRPTFIHLFIFFIDFYRFNWFFIDFIDFYRSYWFFYRFYWFLSILLIFYRFYWFLSTFIYLLIFIDFTDFATILSIFVGFLTSFAYFQQFLNKFSPIHKTIKAYLNTLCCCI